MSISRRGRAYLAPREPGGLPWAGDSGCAPRWSIFASPHRPDPGLASDRAYRLARCSVEPWRRRSRHQGCEEREGSVAANCGPVARGGHSSQSPLLANEAKGMWTPRVGPGHCRWLRQEMGE
jgi:hypothetical protein